MIKTSDVRMRDPFVLPRPTEGRYYLFGTTDPDPWRGAGVGFDVYVGSDLEKWEGPLPAFRPPEGFWADRNFWAPEAHEYRGAFYLFASFKAEDKRRGTQILRADSPAGPYLLHSHGPVTPADWECLDGTFFVDEEGNPWIVFCHEWVQTRDGEVCALRLSRDLSRAEGDPVLLFRGSEAPWTRPIVRRGTLDPSTRVTDGPFLHRLSDGSLLILWSSFSDTGYALGAARSASGTLAGPWVQEEKPILDSDGGHGMVFRGLDGKLRLTFHAPNDTPNERFGYVVVEERGGKLVVSAKE